MSGKVETKGREELCKRQDDSERKDKSVEWMLKGNGNNEGR